jgi:ectoine hydroxylase-related dioxygenase (phytanoyl-CoA dioxygenase family)
LSNMGLTPVSNTKTTQSTPTKSKTSEGTSKTAKSFPGSSEISLESQLDYARNGHAVLRNCVDSSTLQKIRRQVLDIAADQELKAWRQKVQVASDSAELAASCRTVEDCQKHLESLGITASLPFLQYFNTWRMLSEVKELAYALGEAASVLLDVPTVRLYQDSVFWKRSTDGQTPWHADARMAPFDTSHLLTFWIPLEDIPSDGTALMFCSKSHSDLALPYWNPLLTGDNATATSEWDRLEHRYPQRIVDYMPLAMGDVTVHSGWTLHCANGNDGGSDRVALAISYVDAKAELRADALDDAGKGDNEDKWSYQDWAHSVKPRKPFKHDLVPIVWPRRD